MTYKLGQNIIVNVRDFPYSAKGDGVADDTAAIAAAIVALPASGGGQLLFPPGTYNCGTVNIDRPIKIVVNGATIVGTASVIFNVTSNTVVEGNSRLSSALNSAFNGKVFNITGSFSNSQDGYAHFEVRDIALQSPGGTSKGIDTSGLTLGAWNNGLILVENCSFTGFGDTAVYLAPEVNFVRVIRNTFVSNNRSIFSDDNTTLWVQDNEFAQPQGGIEQLNLVGPSCIVEGNLLGQLDNAGVANNSAPDILIAAVSGGGFMWIRKNRFEGEGEGNNHLRSRIKVSGSSYALPVWITENAFVAGNQVINPTTMTRNGSNLVTVSTGVVQHNLQTGGIVNVVNAANPSFNGQYTVTVLSTVSFTYQQSSGGIASTSGASIYLTNNRAIQLLSTIDRWNISNNWFIAYGILIDDVQVMSTGLRIGQSLFRDNVVDMPFPTNGYVTFTNGGRQFAGAEMPTGASQETIRAQVQSKETLGLFNLLQFSEDYTQSAWVKNNALSVTAGFTDPYGTTRANRLVRDGSSAAQNLAQNWSQSPGIAYVTLWGKAGSLSSFTVSVTDTGNGHVLDSIFLSLPSVWKKYKLPVAIPSNGTGTYSLAIYAGEEGFALAGDGYLFGVQVSPYDSDYVPTNASTVSDPTSGSRFEQNIVANVVTAFNVKKFGARGNGVTDDTAALQATINAAAAAHGTVYIPPGIYPHSTTLTVSNVSGMRIEGERSHYGLGGTSTGSVLKWTGSSSGTQMTINDCQNITLNGIHLYGALNGVDHPLVGLNIVSDNSPAVYGILIEHCLFSEHGQNILWGDGDPPSHQSDKSKIDHCEFWNFTRNGIFVDSANALDASRFDNCLFSGASPTADAIYLHAVGFLSIQDCTGGGTVHSFIRANASLINNVLIHSCQIESAPFFLITEGAGDASSIVLLSNTISSPVLLQGGGVRVVGIGNHIMFNITLDSPGAKYVSFGDRFDPGFNAQVVVASGGIFTGQDTIHASGFDEIWSKGQITWQPGASYPAETGIAAEQCIRTGRRSQPWTNGHVYGAGSFVEARVDNGHVFFTVAGGTSGGSEPIWNTSTGATTMDNGITWVEDGYSGAFAGFGPLDHYTGTAAPTNGFYRQGAIVWNTSSTIGSNIAWVCTVTGNPGTWMPVVNNGITPNAAQAQTVWFIDPSNASSLASDLNTGLDATHPLRTMAELYRRWGTYEPVLRQTVTLNFMSSHTDNTDPVIIRPYLANGAFVHINGATPQVLGSGTFAALVNKNRSTGQLWSPTLQSGHGAASLSWLLHNKTHDGYAWVHKIVSGDQVVVSEPMTRAVWPANNTRVTTWANGNSYDILTLTQVNIVDIRPQQIDYDGTFENQVVLHQLSIFDPAGFGSDPIHVGAYWSMEFCRIERSFFSVSETSDLRNDLHNCNFQGGMDPGPNIHCHAGIIFAPFGGTYISALPSTYIEVAYDTILETAGFDGYMTTGFYVRFGGVYIGTGTTLNAAGLLTVTNELADGVGVLWGPGTVNVTYGKLTKTGGATWANTLLQTGGTLLANLTTASSYDNGSPAVWHGGITVNGANLDAAAGAAGFGGSAINPRAGVSITDQVFEPF